MELTKPKPCVPQWIAACMLVLTVSGCGTSTIEFGGDKIFSERLAIELGQPLPSQALTDVHDALRSLFGTANHPALPIMTGPEVVSLPLLERAAGAVYSDQQDNHYGLYRKHCIRCHGTSGNGLGPAARMLSPYPRNFTLGKFKYKSTPIGTKPTRRDLMRTLQQGIPGTSMPSFNLLKTQELEALIDYVIYLTARGETQRQLLEKVAYELDYEQGERLFARELKSSDPETWKQQYEPLENLAAAKLSRWSGIEESLPSPQADVPIWSRVDSTDGVGQQQLMDSINRGRELFTSEVASCSKCHAIDASGQGTPRDYDDWTKDWTTRVGLNPADKNAIRPLLRSGALKPVPLAPRNLQLGVFRGGGQPEELYLRIVHGIEGTPMPAVALRPAVQQGLTTAQVWDLVNYICSLQGTSHLVQLDGPASGQGSVP
jgi:mono/diheme cytochrome c family protein